jgi:UDP-GlcNAc3NAcA epimerase
MKIISIVGTRPQFLKMIPLSLELEKSDNIESIIIHSGQHYDDNMSKDIFTSLNAKMPKYILKRKGNTLIDNLTHMMLGIEKIILQENPGMIIVFGDCDTTTAGALVANKNNIFLVHIEAGMRSYNKKMPEEINRLIVDNISDLLLCSTSDSLDKLKKENIDTPSFFVGNLQLDLLDIVTKKYNDISILKKHNVNQNEFVLLTIHRAYNTNKNTIVKIFQELEKVDYKIIFPIHPRTKNIIQNEDICIPKNLILIPSVNYLNMTILERYSKFIITDSGGIQPEAYFLEKKCIVMRSETEWIEAIENNNNILYDYKTPLDEFINNFLEKEVIAKYNKINASKEIIKIILFTILNNIKLNLFS